MPLTRASLPGYSFGMAEKGTRSQSLRGVVTLAIAWIFVLSAILATAVLTTIFGDPQAGDPVVSMPVFSGEAAVHLSSLPARPVFAGSALVADPALLEATSSGALPRIARDGRTPMRAYAGAASLQDGRPKIAIVIMGLGLSAKQTEAALATLPAPVTLAFVPYAADAGHWATEARRLGHEVLLEVPMEDYEPAGDDPGPHTLRASRAKKENERRLDWALGRFTGYAGVTNIEGDRFLADSEALSPFLAELTRRGLFFFDNGEAPHSIAAEAARTIGGPFARSMLRIDSTDSAADIDGQLAALEAVARRQGWAAGVANAGPETLERLAGWASKLDERGLILAPASTIASEARTE